MKKFFLLVQLSLFVLVLSAQPPNGPANAGMIFGNKTTAEGAVDANELGNVLKDKTSAEIKVKGKVVEVCKAEGCWLKMQTGNGPMMIRMKDHSFMVPLTMNGKTIVAQGNAAITEISVEMIRHYAEDAGKTKEEIAAIKNPQKEMTMQATGILVL